MTARYTWALCALLLGSVARPGSAEDASAERRPAPRQELGIVPLVGGDTDVGYGVGELSTLARVAPGVVPYVWSIDSAAFISFAPGRGPGGSLAIPYQDYFVQVTIPHLARGRLRLQVRPSFTKETTQRYYGLGNASPAPAEDVAERDYYGRTHPTLWLRARYRIAPALFVQLGTSYTHNLVDVRAGSTLDKELRGGTSVQRGLLGEAARSHGVLLGELALEVDTRDNEIDPERGQYHQVKVRVSPALGPRQPYAYQQIDGITRGYLTLRPRRLLAAARVVLDVQLGQPPFYELARYEDTFAFGGLNGIRGVPGQRYYGKVKVFSNWELRSRLVSFRFAKKDLELGAAGFFDVGRLWSELRYHAELDGRGLGLKYGVGGGLRLQEGHTFVVRADVAWSPDARPIGAYVGAGHMF